MTFRLLMIFVFVGCSPSPSNPPSKALCAAVDSLTLACDAQEKALTLEVSFEDGSSFTTTSEPGEPVYNRFLTANSTLSYKLSDSTGVLDERAFITGSLGWPLSVTTYGEATFDGFAGTVTCMNGVAFIADNKGNTRFQTQIDAPEEGELNSIRVYKDGLLLLGYRRILEFHFWDRQVHSYPLDSSLYYHHDAQRTKDGTIYALASSVVEEDGASWFTDKLFVLEPNEEATTLHITSNFELVDPEIPGTYWAAVNRDALDPFHANGLSLHDDEVVISYRHLNLIAGYGALNTADEGQLRWSIVGSAGGQEENSPTAFIGQHDPTVLSDGSLLLFDNQLDTNDARVLWLNTDGSLRHQWSMNQRCPVRGTASLLESGNIFASCASTGWLAEFKIDEEEPVWEARVTCGTQPTAVLPLAQPVMGLW